MHNGWIRSMRRLISRCEVLGTAVVILVAGAQASRAQLPVNSQFGIPASKQINNPVVSPFLNLAQPGLDPGVAYQTLVAPQLQLGNAVALQQQQIGVLQQETAPGRPATRSCRQAQSWERVIPPSS